MNMRTLRLAAAAAVALAFSARLEAQLERPQSRSMTISRHGIVATSQTLASAAGAKVLERGGSAADAAIAANAVIGVVEPMMGGVGGDLMVLYWEAKTKKLYGLNASGWAPAALTIDYLKSRGITNLSAGIHSSPVPGCVDGWAKLHERFGRLPLQDVLKPAIYYAHEGYPVTERVQDYWWHRTTHLMTNKNGRDIFLRNDLAPEVGEVFRNPSLADTLSLIARDGAGAFYRGPIAKSILQTSDQLGGTMAAADLAEYQAEWVEPISTTYRGWTVYEMPPNTQGIGALSMLNIMEASPLAGMGPGSAETLHIEIEAHKLAAEDLRKYVGDPRAVKVPVKGLLSKAYAAHRAALIDPRKANCDPKPGEPDSGDTMYLTVVDRDGNIASLIQSLSRTFGAGIVVEGRGFHLHNRAAGYSLDPSRPNALKPRMRPFHTIIPAFMEKGDLHIGFGIIGGGNQPQAHAQFVANIVDFQMNIQAALDAPRFMNSDTSGCEVRIEQRISADVRQQLEVRGHKVDLRADYSNLLGPGQAVMHDSAKGVNYGASDPRGDGAAVPEAPVF
jgi:gamma-glutamyltranspeptidase/glutathione hydrolase